MPQWWSDMLEKSTFFMPHGHCYLWIPSLLWLHVVSDLLIGAAYVGISVILYLLVRKIRLPFSPVFVAFGLFIGLCGLTHFMQVWTVWNPDYWAEGVLKSATATASVATAVGLFFIRPQVEEVVYTARLSEERRVRLESAHAELEALYQKLSALDELKTRFFANVSHELRTPLALMLGPAERMLGDANLTDEQRRQLESMHRNGLSLLRQVNDLLDVAKLEAGGMQLRYARAELAPWFRGIATQFEAAAQQREIRYRIDTPGNPVAEIDPDLIERVVINLLGNAFKFTPAGGAVAATLAGDEEGFSITVADSGPGIRPELREQIFERFRQGDDSATRAYGGTGLGLAIVKDFVALHGGTVEVGSAELGGAKFVVRLPLLAAGAAAAAQPHPNTETRVALASALQDLAPPAADPDVAAPLSQIAGRATALVVEDNHEMRSFVATVLNQDFNVVTARDGQEGFERAEALRPDLIVTDVMMPRMSGDQLVAALRARAEFDAVPVLLLTAKADDELRVRLLQAGAQDYLTKPFLAQELRARAGNLASVKRAGDTLRRELNSLSVNVEMLAGELAAKHHQLRLALDAAEVAREQAEHASEVKGRFLALVSHELRTPLSTIHLNAQLLERLRDRLPDIGRPAMERLARASRQMTTMVEGLLEYTRLDNGRIDSRFEPVDTVAMAQEVVEMHQVSVGPGVALHLEVPSTALPPFISDARLLRVVLSNLISNALKFTEQGSVTLRLARAGDMQIFEIEDTGIGIPTEDMPRIFQPFEQLEPVRRKSIPGVGLGLALVKQIVDTFGGEIHVRSEIGAGSTFIVRLPEGQLPAIIENRA